MGMFSLDDKAAMYDVTPVENQFILTYLPSARGDHVKVYLYGLMQCRHPQADSSLEQMARELNMSPEEVLAAYRHWEFAGLVHRVSDDPPAFRYRSLTEMTLSGDSGENDPAYTQFAEALYAAFDNRRKLHGRETTMAWEWVTELRLPPEVVLMLVQYMIDTKGANFTFVSAQKVAAELAEQDVRTVEKAEAVLSENGEAWRACRDILRRLGKRRNPSDAELAMYRKWTQEWGYTKDAIEAACAETVRGEPNFAYLDGILRGMRERHGSMTSAEQVEKNRQADEAKRAPLRKLLQAMNIQGASINPGTLAAYEEMRSIYPDDSIILLAGYQTRIRENDLLGVQAKLNEWKREGLQTREEIIAYLNSSRNADNILRDIYATMGVRLRPNKADRALLARWMDEWHMPAETLLCFARYARGKENPMAYLNRLAEASAAQGKTTPEQVEAAHRAWQEKNAAAQPASRGGKVNHQLQYTQRPFREDEEEMPAWLQQRWKEMNGDAQ